jgi:hypothetical protein
MQNLGYAAEKLAEAVEALALGAGRINSRVEEAAAWVAQASAAKSHMPRDLGAKYDALWARLTAVHAQGDEASVRATLSQMSEQEACSLANQIVDVAFMAEEVLDDPESAADGEIPSDGEDP